MKILFLQDDFPPESLGGAGMVSFNLAKKLKELGHQVYVITTVQDEAKKGSLDYEGIKILRIYSNYHERWRAYLSLYNPQIVGKVKKIIKQIKPDIVHANNVHYYLSYYSLKIAKKYSQAVFLTFHDVMSFHYGKLIEFINPNDLSIPKKFDYKISYKQQIKRFKKRYNPFRNIIIKHYLNYVDKFFAVSYALKDALNQNGINYQIDVIYNGIDIDKWDVDINQVEKFKQKYNLEGKKVVFFGGKLSSLKGGQEILKAMEIVRQKVSNVVLLIIGRQSDYVQKMINMAQEKNIPIITTGWIDKDEMKIAYANSDLVVVPSICFDSFPTVNLEAMVSKKPIIGTCFGGASEVIKNNSTGYIINPFNTKELADKILDLLSNLEKSKEFGENGFKRIKENFSIEKQAEQVLEWYKKYV